MGFYVTSYVMFNKQDILHLIGKDYLVCCFKNASRRPGTYSVFWY